MIHAFVRFGIMNGFEKASRSRSAMQRRVRCRPCLLGGPGVNNELMFGAPLAHV